jgi:hypothetical protein
LRSGLVRGSFIPPWDIRDLRDLNRYKRKSIQTIVAKKQRVEKVLEDANIKLSSIASKRDGDVGAKRNNFPSLEKECGVRSIMFAF